MIKTVEASDSGYRFMPGVSQYSCGIAALEGFTIERVRFAKRGAAESGLCADRRDPQSRRAGRSRRSRACELRSPAPFTEEGFGAFNEIYIKTLIEWGVMKDGVNPVARSNVCPKIDPPAEPGFHAFAFTVPAPKAPASFVIAGSGESVEGKANYRDHIVRPGDTSPAGMLEKAKFVLGRDGAPHERVRRRLEPDHRRAALHRTGTSIRCSRANWAGAACSGTGSPGISTGRRFKVSNTKWIAAASIAKEWWCRGVMRLN